MNMIQPTLDENETEVPREINLGSYVRRNVSESL